MNHFASSAWNLEDYYVSKNTTQREYNDKRKEEEEEEEEEGNSLEDNKRIKI